MRDDIIFLTEIKKEVDDLDCWNCGKKLSFKSIEFDEVFNPYEDNTVKIEAHCKYCKVNPVLLMEVKA